MKIEVADSFQYRDISRCVKTLLSSVHRRIAETVLAMEQRQEPPFVSDLVRRLGYAAESSLTATLRIMERNGFLVIQGGGEKGRSRVGG